VNFLLAAAEIALAAFGETKIEELKESNDKYVYYFERLNENQEQVYSSIHLAFTFLTVLISIIGYFLFSSWIYLQLISAINLPPIYSIGILVFVTTVLVTTIILVFNVLVPKAIAYRYSDFIGKRSIKIILLLSSTLKFVTGAITAFSNLILLPFKEKINFSEERPSEDEIIDIISDGVKS